ncbi:MAG: hypothetical protein HRT65_09940 [Flavobacteriaceae bacterium]|nr:hypothetical protein [Flavobacteriaceae bacterium]
MSDLKMSPEQSIQLIGAVIEEAKTRFEENGVIYMFWGLFVSLIALTQFLLLYWEEYAISWYPYLAIPLGLVFTFGYYWNKNRYRNRNQISSIISKTWLFLAINKMVLGFFFAPVLGENLSPIILILLATGILISGIALKSTVLIISSILINIAALCCFQVSWLYQPLVMSGASFLAVMVPGLFMYNKAKHRERMKSPLGSA